MRGYIAVKRFSFKRERLTLFCATRCRFTSSSPATPQNSSSNPAQRNIAIPRTVQLEQRKQHGGSREVLQKTAAKALLNQLQKEALWEGVVIDQTDHHLIRHFVELLRNGKYRSSRKMMCVAGEKFIHEICETGHYPRHLLMTEGKQVPKWVPSNGVDIVSVSASVASSCFPGNDGYMGDFQIPDPPPKEELMVNKQAFDRVLVLDNVQDEGTLGTLLRTAAGFQYDAVFLVNHCADLYNHKVVQSARGAHFQKSVPFYSFKEEDGDDTNAMLRHVVRRNKLKPVIFSPKDDKDHCSFKFPASIACERRCGNAECGTVQPLIQPLSRFCFENFSASPSKTEEGLMVILSPNHKGTAFRRFKNLLRPSITTLQLDVPVSDFLISSSIVLHALRPSGNWEYLPVHLAHSKSSFDLQMQRTFVDLGPDRLVVGEKDLSLDEAEQIEAANSINEYGRWKRLERRRKTDYDFWMEGEVDRINQLYKKEKQHSHTPWRSQAAKSPTQMMPSWVPNIIDEYRQSPGRDYLREAKEDALHSEVNLHSNK